MLFPAQELPLIRMSRIGYLVHEADEFAYGVYIAGGHVFVDFSTDEFSETALRVLLSISDMPDDCASGVEQGVNVLVYSDEFEGTFFSVLVPEKHDLGSLFDVIGPVFRNCFFNGSDIFFISDNRSYGKTERFFESLLNF